MKITIPEHIGEITLDQYQKYYELLQRDDLQEHERNIRKIRIFTGLNPTEVKLISSSDYAEILSQIDIALDNEPVFNPFFTIADIEFGFIPNFDKITAGEYMDITKYEGSIETMHNLMAILFRPIKKKDIIDNYSIIDYQGTEQYAKIMKLMPLSAVNGALVFFSILSKELVNYTQKFTQTEQAKGGKLRTTLKSGDGMQLSTN